MRALSDTDISNKENRGILLRFPRSSGVRKSFRRPTIACEDDLLWGKADLEQRPLDFGTRREAEIRYLDLGALRLHIPCVKGFLRADTKPLVFRFQNVPCLARKAIEVF